MFAECPLSIFFFSEHKLEPLLKFGTKTTYKCTEGNRAKRKKFLHLVVLWRTKNKHNSKHRDRPRDGGIVFDGMRWRQYSTKWRYIGIIGKRCFRRWWQYHEFFESDVIRLRKSYSLKAGLFLYKTFSKVPTALNHVAFEKLNIK